MHRAGSRETAHVSPGAGGHPDPTGLPWGTLFDHDQLELRVKTRMFSSTDYCYVVPPDTVLATASGPHGKQRSFELADSTGATVAVLAKHGKGTRARLDGTLRDGTTITVTRRPKLTRLVFELGSAGLVWLSVSSTGPRCREFIGEPEPGVPVVHVRRESGVLRIDRRPGLVDPLRSSIVLVPLALQVLTDDFARELPGEFGD